MTPMTDSERIAWLEGGLIGVRGRLDASSAREAELRLNGPQPEDTAALRRRLGLLPETPLVVVIASAVGRIPGPAEWNAARVREVELREKMNGLQWVLENTQAREAELREQLRQAEVREGALCERLRLSEASESKLRAEVERLGSELLKVYDAVGSNEVRCLRCGGSWLVPKQLVGDPRFDCPHCKAAKAAKGESNATP